VNSRESIPHIAYDLILRWQVFLPLGPDIAVVPRNVEGLATLRANRLVEELHAGLFRRAAGLAAVAGDAGSNQVLPRVLSVLAARNDMVDRERDARFPAVLAGVMVAVEDFEAGKLGLRAGPLDLVGHPDNRGQSKSRRRRMGETGAVFEHFSLAAVDEHERTRHMADIERLVVLV
jgi:hypothetical protein